jgi:hypothetical protein
MKSRTWRAAVSVALAIVADVGTPSHLIAQSVRDTLPQVTLSEARRRTAPLDPTVVAARGQVETAVWERRAAVSDLLTTA